MKVLDIKSLERKDDFLVIDNKKYKVIFSTAEDGKNFNRHTDDGVKTLLDLKDEFDVNDVIYLRQVHSDTVYVYEGDKRDDFIENEGDAIVTNDKNVIVGVFTADCVPVILVDEENNVISAIHSGWKGTFNCITKKAIDKMKSVYGTNPKNIKAYIGPHIRQCCYEVSEELKDKFISEKNIDENKLFKGRNLNMEICIEKDLLDSGVEDENIYSLGLCTYCSDEVKLHSYRKSGGSYGRLFSFVVLK